MSALLILFFLACFGFCSVIAELTFHVLEEEPIHTYIGSVNASSKSNKSSRFLFIEPKTHLFSIDKDSGKIYNAERIDREDLCGSRYPCVLDTEVRIDSATVEIVTVKIYIVDINDNAPMFDKDEALKVSENKLNKSYSILEAWDFDSGNNSAIYYTLLDNINNTFSLIWNEDQTLGLKVMKTLDYEKQTFYRLTLVAKDQGIPQRTGSTFINITVLDENDNSPKFEKVFYNQTIFENVPVSSTILTLHAVDKDSGQNGEVKYKLNRKTSLRIREIFEVKESSGTVILKGSLGKRHQYSFDVIAYDQGSRRRSASVTVTINIVDVNDNSPVIDIDPPLANVSESKTVNSHVAVVHIQDNDKGDNGKVNCSIAVTSQYFGLNQISSITYEIVIKRELDFEHITTYNITIECEDNGIPKLKSKNTLVVNVIDENDNPPVFTNDIKIVDITENNKVPEIITQVKATDKDYGMNSEIYYYLDSDNASDFILDNRTGVITTNKIFDRETISVVQLRVLAVDCGILPLTGTGTVQLKILDVNDNVPKFQKQHYEFHTLEAQARNTTIATVEAKDLDAGENGAVTYVIENSNRASELFTVSDGILKTKAVLSRTKGRRYDFLVVATDHGKKPLNSSTSITVIVEDANDNYPCIIYPSDANNSISISYEMTLADQPISQVIAFDDDEGENARLSYFLKNTPETTSFFRINETSGEIMLIKNGNVSRLRQNYKLLISVKDHGKPAQHTATVLLVNIIDGKPLTSKTNHLKIILPLCIIFIIVFIIGFAYMRFRTNKEKRRYFAKKYEDASLRRKQDNFPKENEFNNNSGKSVALNGSTSEGNYAQSLQGNENSHEAADSLPPDIHTQKESGNNVSKEPSFQYSNLLCKDDANNSPAEEIEESQIRVEPEVSFTLDRASIKGSCAALIHA
ncbi:protocadherin-9 [Octopus bimaculoides]|uniref:Cadherin domain-containing protein n=1 Tax=Octopus bimaculoides TaxID=37653 RepID=A0A0L8IDV8_OCTBM|nr:protocadherin-9 [Octopus bimaculoides]|eukprot:XP_014774158.1 PREDICTED: protocadherin-9-like [Octopus bimaculoides]